MTEAAFVAVYPSIAARLATSLRGRHRRLTEQDAEDIVGETMARAWRHLATIDEARLHRWLWTVAHRLVIDRARHELGPTFTRRFYDYADLWPRAAPSSDPELPGLVALTLAGLTERQRAVLVLHDAAGVTNTEIGRSIGITPAAVSLRCRRARAAFRARWGGDAA